MAIGLVTPATIRSPLDEKTNGPSCARETLVRINCLSANCIALKSGSNKTISIPALKGVPSLLTLFSERLGMLIWAWASTAPGRALATSSLHRVALWRHRAESPRPAPELHQ